MTKHWIVVGAEGGPATPPYPHSTESSAETEARRLADRLPGKRFLVYECVGSAHKVSVVYERFRDDSDDEPPF